MKNYEPLSAHYRELLAACRSELITLGYATTSVRLSGAGEFLRRMEEAGKTRLIQIDPQDVKLHYAYLYERPSAYAKPLSGHTISNYMFSLRLLFGYAERYALIPASPLSGLKFRQPKVGRKLVCSRADIERLYQACEDDRSRAVLHLLYGCGLRRMEASALDTGDVDYRAALLYVRRGKGKKRRVIPLGERVGEELERYEKGERKHYWSRRSGQAYLLDDRGGRMRGSTLWKRLRALVERAGLNPKISPHVLRHSIATHLLAQGMAVEKVRDFLGHEHIDTTQIYTHVKTEEL